VAIGIDTGITPNSHQLFELAMRYQLSSYDAAYLELAIRYALPLATQDVQLKQAAIAAGITLCA
jgi:predicted nucleic acid-binding protein